MLAEAMTRSDEGGSRKWKVEIGRMNINIVGWDAGRKNIIGGCSDPCCPFSPSALLPFSRYSSVTHPAEQESAASGAVPRVIIPVPDIHARKPCSIP